MDKQKFLKQQRRRRRLHVRRRIRGTTRRPRLSVFRSHRNIHCQLIDDSNARTLASATTREREVRESLAYGGNAEAAQTVGRLIAERALAAGVEAVCLDRGSYKYHGRVAALADAAREAGLKF